MIRLARSSSPSPRYSLRNGFAAFSRRWFRLPAALELLLARRMECRARQACRSNPVRDSRKPTVLALEGREAPQLVLPLAVGAAAGAAVVGQMLASPPSAQAAEYVDVSVA